MKDYSDKHKIQFLNSTILLVSSLLLGSCLGVLSFFAFQLFYLPLVVPILFSLLTLRCFDKLTDFIKVPSKHFNNVCGFVMGLSLVFLNHYSNYYDTRHTYIADIQSQEHFSLQTAATLADSFYSTSSGQTGFLGYELYRAKEGEQHTLTTIHVGLPEQSFSYTLQGVIYWIYYSIEAGIILFLCTTMANQKKVFYNDDEEQWYQRFPKRIGTIEIEKKETFLKKVKSKEYQEAALLISTQDVVHHPVCEINSYSLANNSNRFHLLELLNTKRISSDYVTRTPVYRGEIAGDEFASLVRYIV